MRDGQMTLTNHKMICISLMTPGANPYPGMSGRDVMDMVRQGKRMERPEHCAEEV